MLVRESDHSDERQPDKLERQHETNSLGGDMCGGSVAGEFREKKRGKKKQRNGYANDQNPTHRMETSADIDLPKVGLYRAVR